jgi:hypothetical protein
MERRLGDDQAMMHDPVTLTGPGKRLLAAALAAFMAAAPASAQYYGERTLRYGNTSGYFFDGRDDNRDFPTDSFFPGNFAADPIYATIGGAAGFLGSNPRRSAVPYPSQVYFGFARDRIDCRLYRYHDALKNQACGHGPQRSRGR